MEERLLTLHTVMEIFDVSRSTVSRWIRSGNLEQRKLGCSSKVYITKSSVDKLIGGEDG